MFYECTLKGFLDDKVGNKNENKTVPRIPMTINSDPLSTSLFIAMLIFIFGERCSR